MLEKAIHQMVCEAVYAACADQAYTLPNPVAEHLIEKLKGHVTAALVLPPMEDERFAPFFAVLRKMVETHCIKSKDYGRTTDPYANVRASEDFGIPAWIGCLIRGHDKTIRIQSFLANGALANESLEDALLDRCVYDVMAYLLWQESQKGDNKGASHAVQ